jgi:hypothetical protein
MLSRRPTQEILGLTLLVVATGAVGAGCSDGAYGTDANRPDEIVIGRGDGPFPDATLTDWVSYAVQVGEVEVLAEREIPPPKTVFERGEGYIGRSVTIRTGTTYWVSPGAVAAPSEIEIVVSGWVLRSGKRLRFALLRSPRIEVGGKYNMPLVTILRNGQVEWSPLSPPSVFEVRNDATATNDVHTLGNSPLANSLSKMSDSELRRALAEAPIDPVAMKYWHLPPYERVKAVGAEM